MRQLLTVFLIMYVSFNLSSYHLCIYRKFMHQPQSFPGIVTYVILHTCVINHRGSQVYDGVQHFLKINTVHFFHLHQGTLKIEGRTTHKFVYTRLLKFLLYSRAIQIDPCCLVQALYR